MVEVGKRYTSAGGAEVIATKGGPGTLSDGDTPMQIKGATGEAPPAGKASPDAPQIQLGKRYRSPDGVIELLVIKPGPADLRYDGAPLELMQPKVLPSAD
jgi:hypothetical protein